MRQMTPGRKKGRKKGHRMLMEDRRWWFYSTVDEAELHDAAYAVNHCECQNVDGTRSHVGLRPQRHDADNTGNERPGWEGAFAPLF